MKLSKFSKLNFFKTLSQCQLLPQYSTTPAEKQTESAETLLLQKKEKDRILFEPALTTNALQALNDITSVTVATNNVSWAKISIPNMTLLEWNAITLPSMFQTTWDEANILGLAISISQNIPNSDMYVVENCLFRSLVFKEHMLRTAILILLKCLEKALELGYQSNGSKMKSEIPTFGNKAEDMVRRSKALFKILAADAEIPSKVVFQKPLILNTLCNILVCGERTSAYRIVRNILKPSRSWDKYAEGSENTLECYSLINVDEKQKKSFLNYNIAKKESLSLALLIGLTFLEINIIQSSTSISKIQSKIHAGHKKAQVKSR